MKDKEQQKEQLLREKELIQQQTEQLVTENQQLVNGNQILEVGIHSFIHSFLGRWANHDHLTSSLKHIINQTNI